MGLQSQSSTGGPSFWSVFLRKPRGGLRLRPTAVATEGGRGIRVTRQKEGKESVGVLLGRFWQAKKSRAPVDLADQSSTRAISFPKDTYGTGRILGGLPSDFLPV